MTHDTYIHVHRPDPPRSIWTDELRNQISELWSTHTATQISNILKDQGYVFSKNAIIGALKRMDAPIKPRGPRKPRPTRAKNRSGEHHVVTKIVRANGNSNVMRIFETVRTDYQLACDEVVSRDLTLLELEPNDCRYAYGDSGAFKFCGHRVRDGSSYCPFHHARIWIPAKPPASLGPNYAPTNMSNPSVLQRRNA